METHTLLQNFAHKTIKTLERDATYAEAFFTTEKTREVIIRNSEILIQNIKEDAGVGFRVALGSRVGFACTNRLSEETVEETGKKALVVARVSSEVPHFALPGPGNLPSVPGLYHARTADATVEEAVDIARRAIAAAQGYDSRVIVKSGRVRFSSGWRGIVNSLGVDCLEKETRAVLSVGGTGEQNDEVTGFCPDFTYTRAADLNPEEIGESVGRKVVDMFSPRPIDTFTGTVIFGPEAVSYQLADVLIDALKGESVIAGRSFWTGKTGQPVASELLTVADNALLYDGFSSRGFDDEGCPSQNTLLMQKGVLVQFLQDAASAKALKANNTGNASRFTGGFDLVSNIVGKGYRTTPEIYPSNLVVQPGRESKDDLISDVDKGVLIESMDGFAQAGSGLVSARLARSFSIKNGKIQHPIKDGMVSGTAFDWFNHISGVGADVKKFPNATVPSIRVEDVTVVGS